MKRKIIDRIFIEILIAFKSLKACEDSIWTTSYPTAMDESCAELSNGAQLQGVKIAHDNEDLTRCI